MNVELAEGKVRYDAMKMTVSEIIRSINQSLILTLDEAQMIRVGRARESDDAPQIAHLFDQLHNLENEHGLVFFIAGLSDAREILRYFNISRFNDGCVINLTPIDPEAEKNILKGYLVKGAGVDLNHPQLKDWIAQMAEETQGWAQHIVVYGQVASRIIKANGGDLSQKVLSQILTASRGKKKKYYEGRFVGLNEAERASIFNAVFENELQENVIMGSRVKANFEINPMIKNSRKMFQELVSRGILQMSEGGFYRIPIPSLKTWMLEQYQSYLNVTDQKPSFKIQQLIASIQKSKEMKSNHQKTIE